MVDTDSRTHFTDADARIDRPFLDVPLPLRRITRCVARKPAFVARHVVPRVLEGVPKRGARARDRNRHPTVKPCDLMRWLVRLIAPPGGIVLDPFMGSGSTAKAAMLEGFDFIGCELDATHAEVAELRISDAGGLFCEMESDRK